MFRSEPNVSIKGEFTIILQAAQLRRKAGSLDVATEGFFYTVLNAARIETIWLARKNFSRHLLDGQGGTKSLRRLRRILSFKRRFRDLQIAQLRFQSLLLVPNLSFALCNEVPERCRHNRVIAEAEFLCNRPKNSKDLTTAKWCKP